MFRVLTTLIASLLAVYIGGCGPDEAEIEIQEDVPVNFVSVIPPSGTTIAANATLTLVFDNNPTDVKSSVGNGAQLIRISQEMQTRHFTDLA